MKGVIFMSTVCKLNLGKVNKRIVNTISTQEALRNITPLKLDQDVIDGNSTICITDAKEEGKNICVRLETSY